jgi:hypothetical protein
MRAWALRVELGLTREVGAWLEREQVELGLALEHELGLELDHPEFDLTRPWA